MTLLSVEGSQLQLSNLAGHHKWFHLRLWSVPIACLLSQPLDSRGAESEVDMAGVIEKLPVNALKVGVGYLII